MALSLAVNKICKCKEKSEINEVLDNIEKYDKSIDKQYYSHWNVIKKNTEFVKLFGIFSRLPNGISWSWVKEWESSGLIEQFQNGFYYYFSKDNDKWRFFHNSFKVFVERKTAESPMENWDERDRYFHNLIADRLFQSEKNFGEIFHYHKANKFEKILEISKYKYYHKQLKQFRPLKNHFR